MSSWTPFRRLSLALVIAAALTAIAGAAVAGAYSTAPGYTASDYATGLPSAPCCQWGPIGVAFDHSDNLYVTDAADGNLYRFQPGGGRAADARLSAQPIAGGPAGLAVTRDGGLYAALGGAGSVVQLDPGTGAVTATIVSGLPCATGLAADPVSGDLFVSVNGCGSAIWRISIHGSSGVATPYATGIENADGLAFGGDGTLYAAAAGSIVAIDGTSSASPGSHRTIGAVPNSDGIAYAPATVSHGPYLVVNRTDGAVTRLNLSDGSTSDIFEGGSRGDFTAVDSNGCLFATQSDRIVRIARDVGCVLIPTTPAAGGLPLAKVTTTVLNSAKPACAAAGRLTLRLSQSGRVRLRSAVIYVDHRRVRSLGARGVTRPVVLTHLPARAFTVEIVARTASGKTLRSSKRYTSCKAAKRKGAAKKRTSRRSGR